MIRRLSLVLLLSCASAAESDPLAISRLAAEAGEWDLAADALEEARQAAPGDPALLHDCALACERAGGRDLMAYAYYVVFLRSGPAPEKAARVRGRMDALAVRIRASVDDLLRAALETAGDIRGEGRERTLSLIAETQAVVGDEAGALRTAARIPLALKQRRETLEAIARTRETFLNPQEAFPEDIGEAFREMRELEEFNDLVALVAHLATLEDPEVVTCRLAQAAGLLGAGLRVLERARP